MSKDIDIPPEALEAAAAEIFKIRLAERPYPHSPRLIEWLIDVSRENASAALRAGIAAWPGMKFAGPTGGGLSQEPFQSPLILLPISTENTDAEA